MDYTYILRCGDGSLYTGWTNDLDRRVKAHAAGKGGKYTRSRLPVELVWFDTNMQLKEDIPYGRISAMPRCRPWRAPARLRPPPCLTKILLARLCHF